MEDYRESVQKEGLKIALKHESGGTLSLPMRVGKTLLGLNIASNFNKVLVAYPTLQIRESWLSDASKFGISIENIFFTTFASLDKHNLQEYEAVILDECHDVSIANWEYISRNLPKRLYAMSGTVPITGEKKQYIDQYCPVIYKISIDETTGKTNKDYEIIVHLIEPSSKQDILLKSGKYWSEKQKISFFQNNYNRNRDFSTMLLLIKAIQNSQTKLDKVYELAEQSERALLFVETIKQCDYLNYPSFHSKNKKSEENLQKFQNKEINKLSSIGQLKAGITFEHLNEGIILHCYSSNNKAAQKIGRMLNYMENQIATIHIICLKGTADERWTAKGLQEFDQSKIKYIT